MDTFAEPDHEVEYARSRWEDGEARVQRFTGDSHRRHVLERVIDGILYELEKRVGQTFTSRELARLHDASEGWCTDIAHEQAPEDPWAWDLDMVQSAAFYRFARRASDYQLTTGQH